MGFWNMDPLNGPPESYLKTRLKHNSTLHINIQSISVGEPPGPGCVVWPPESFRSPVASLSSNIILDATSNQGSWLVTTMANIKSNKLINLQ